VTDSVVILFALLWPADPPRSHREIGFSVIANPPAAYGCSITLWAGRRVGNRAEPLHGFRWIFDAQPIIASWRPPPPLLRK